MKVWMTAGLLLMTAFAARAETPAQKPVEQICAERACRAGGYEAVVRIDDEHYKTVPVGPSPYVTEDDEILIFPGETLAIQFTIVDGKPTAPTFYKAFSADFPAQVAVDDKVATNPRDAELPRIEGETTETLAADLPPDTLLISYGQWEGMDGMVMKLDHNMAEMLKLDATMFLIGTGTYNMRYTSTCPIGPGRGVYESWPHEIGPMLLSKFRFLKDGDRTVCQ